MWKNTPDFSTSCFSSECCSDTNVKHLHKQIDTFDTAHSFALLVSLIALFFFQIYIGMTRVSDLTKETFNLIPDVNISLWYCNVGKGKHGNLPEQGQYHNKVDVSPFRLTSKGIKAFLSSTSNKMAHATKVGLLKSSIAISVVHQFRKRSVHTVVNCF